MTYHMQMLDFQLVWSASGFKERRRHRYHTHKRAGVKISDSLILGYQCNFCPETDPNPNPNYSSRKQCMVLSTNHNPFT